jgi:type VI secretion system secreted protein Hcp
MMQMDRSTIQLQQALVSGKVIPTADLTYIKTGETTLEFYKMHIENVRVDAVQESGSNEKPTVSVSLSYSRIAWKYTMQDNTGGAGESTTGGWDFAASKAFNYYQ